MLGIGALVTVLYLVVLLVAISGWLRLRQFQPSGAKPSTRLSIILPIRNEATHLSACLASLEAQNYPPERVEIFLINDASTDESPQIIDTFLRQPDRRYAYHYLQNTEALGKKASLERAISLASGEWIITRDADTLTVSTHWLSTLAACMEQEQADMMLAPVDYRDTHSSLQQFQELEHQALLGIGAGFAAWQRPFLCSGANLAFRRASFFELGGYAAHRHIASGDDVLLLESFKAAHKKIIWLQSREAIVETWAESELRPFLHQRVRWAGKHRHNPNPWNTLLAVLVLFANLLLPTGLLLFLCASQAAVLFLVFAGLKVFIDFLLLFLVATFRQKRLQLGKFFLFEGCYGGYAITVAMTSLWMRPQWKGINVR